MVEMAVLDCDIEGLSATAGAGASYQVSRTNEVACRGSEKGSVMAPFSMVTVVGGVRA